MRNIVVSAVMALFVFGCGSGAEGPPGSWGSDKTNMLALPSVVPDALEVDICNSAPVTVIANITARTINPDLPENTLYVEGYTITYTALRAGTPPIEGDTYPLSLELPSSGVELIFIDRARKASYQGYLGAGPYSSLTGYSAYYASYTFFGRDRFGSDFGATAVFPFLIGRDVCELSVLPEEISVTSGASVEFHISGGEGPYTVYSDNISVIPDPGQLGAGDSTFTVTPSSVFALTEVTISVLDSAGNLAASRVAVYPF